jgi:hypothetical protein
MSYGVAMIPEEAQHPEPAPSDKSEEKQPKDSEGRAQMEMVSTAQQGELE